MEFLKLIQSIVLKKANFCHFITIDSVLPEIKGNKI